MKLLRSLHVVFNGISINEARTFPRQIHHSNKINHNLKYKGNTR